MALRAFMPHDSRARWHSPTSAVSCGRSPGPDLSGRPGIARWSVPLRPPNKALKMSFLTARVPRALALGGYIMAGAAYAIAWFPIALWCTAVAGACRARIALGRWPGGYHQPAGYLEVLKWTPAWLSDAAFLISLTALAVGSALVAQRVARPRWSWAVCAPLVTGLGWGAFYLLLQFDPGGILGWWMD